MASYQRQSENATILGCACVRKRCVSTPDAARWTGGSRSCAVLFSQQAEPTPGEAVVEVAGDRYIGPDGAAVGFDQVQPFRGRKLPSSSRSLRSLRRRLSRVGARRCRPRLADERGCRSSLPASSRPGVDSDYGERIAINRRPLMLADRQVDQLPAAADICSRRGGPHNASRGLRRLQGQSILHRPSSARLIQVTVERRRTRLILREPYCGVPLSRLASLFAIKEEMPWKA